MHLLGSLNLLEDVRKEVIAILSLQFRLLPVISGNNLTADGLTAQAVKLEDRGSLSESVVVGDFLSFLDITQGNQSVLALQNMLV